MTLPVLPTYYYLDHFKEMLSFVEGTYASVLDAEHHDFIQRFRALTSDEQCLFVRMTNRRGDVFCASHLRYAEIGDVGTAIANLTRNGFLRALSEGDYLTWLCTLKKDVLLSIARDAGRKEFRASWKKPQLIQNIADHIPFVIAAQHGNGDGFVVRTNTAALNFLFYLYFGKTSDGLKSFALRDLGIIRVNDAAQFKARFEDPAEARACFYYAHLLDRLAVAVAQIFDEGPRR